MLSKLANDGRQRFDGKGHAGRFGDLAFVRRSEIEVALETSMPRTKLLALFIVTVSQLCPIRKRD